MKHMRLTFEDSEFSLLLERKDARLTWKEFFIGLAKKLKKL